MLGEVVRDLRNRRRMSQTEASDASKPFARTGDDFSPAWLSRIEANAIETPDPRKLRTLAHILGVDANDLLVEAGYVRRDKEGRSLEELSTEELTTQASKLWDEITRRVTQASRLSNGTDPSGRRYSRGGAAVLERP